MSKWGANVSSLQVGEGVEDDRGNGLMEGCSSALNSFRIARCTSLQGMQGWVGWFGLGYHFLRHSMDMGICGNCKLRLHRRRGWTEWEDG